MPLSDLRRRTLVVALVSLFALAGAAPALADGSPTVIAQAPPVQTGTLTGTVKSAAGAYLAGTVVTAAGPVTKSATTLADGSYSLTLPPGVYKISVTRGGFQPLTEDAIAVVAATSVPLNVTLSPEDLSSLRTIGHTTTAPRGTSGTFNTGAASSTYVSAQVFSNLANPQVNDVLERIPDVTVEHMGSQQDTALVVGGLQPYETQVLIDGHPIALGQYGVWLSHLFPSYLVGGVEVNSGPGNTTPFANLAVGGTINMLTPNFTQQTTAEFTTGIDRYNAQYSDLLLTGSVGGLQYVAAAGYGGYNGPYFKKQGCAVSEDYATVANTPGSTGIVQFCGDMSGSLYTKGTLLKLNYNFTPTTSFQVGFVGSFGGFSPQGSAWGNALGPTLIESCMQASPLTCTSPNDQNLIGKTITAYSWYPGTIVTNTQQLYTAQLRTSIGDNTLLVRPYVGAIQPESYDGTDEGYYPSFWGPGPGSPNYPGPPSLAPGVQIPSTGLPNPNIFEAPFADGGTCPVGTIYSYSQINSPSNTIVSKNGQEECFQYPYTFYEQDKLYGTTFSLIHPMGDSSLDFTYDFHGQSTFAYANTPSNVTVPFSATRYSTFSLTGDLRYVRNLALDFGLYDTSWTIDGTKALLDSSGNPVFNTDGSPVIVGLDRTVSRFDPHLALIFRPDPNDSYRASWGTSETFPFIGDVSGTAAYQPFAQSAPLYTLGIFTEKNPNLQPEFSSAYDLGVDHRFHSGGVLSVDFAYTIVHDVFQQLTLAENTTFQGATGVLGIFLPINVAQLSAETFTAKYNYAPPKGLGYSMQVAADRSILSGIPQGAYNGNAGFPVNNVQLCGNGLFTPGLATCIPYLKAYGSISYRTLKGDYAGLGIQYEGKNNPYYQPPFAVADLTLRHPFTKNLDLQIAVENLLNTNAFSALPAPNAGVPIVAETSSGQTTYASTLIPYLPRTYRVELRAHLGR